jgi:hypothetical protein
MEHNKQVRLSFEIYSGKSYISKKYKRLPKKIL